MGGFWPGDNCRIITDTPTATITVRKDFGFIWLARRKHPEQGPGKWPDNLPTGGPRAAALPINLLIF